MMASSVRYEELSPAEFVERLEAFPVAYLPLGTLEWHGLHLPLGSDGIQARGVFERLAARIGGIVLPMLFLGPDSAVERDGSSYYGMDYHSFEEGAARRLPGSAYYIEGPQFDVLLDTVMRNLARAGFTVVVGHGHGPSTQAFAARKERFARDFGLETRNLWELGYEGAEGIMTDHAAANETSLVMALRPELADPGRLPAEEVPVSVWGADPRRNASAERGERIIARNVERAAELLGKLAAGRPAARQSLAFEGAKSLLEKE